MSKSNRSISIPSAVLACLILMGCGGTNVANTYCEQMKECAKKGGNAFSMTYCESKSTSELEIAQSQNCGQEYSHLSDCVATLPCSPTAEQLMANCGAVYKAYAQCMPYSVY